MSKSSAFLFTNNVESTHPVTPKVLGLTTNYAVTADTANDAVLSNKTAPVDAEEIVSYRSRTVSQINTQLNIQNPAKVSGGIQYSINIEDTLVTTDSDDSSFRVDEPIVATLSIRHGKSGNITNAIVAQVVNRLISACLREDGTWRFDDLMRSAERPVAD